MMVRNHCNGKEQERWPAPRLWLSSARTGPKAHLAAAIWVCTRPRVNTCCSLIRMTCSPPGALNSDSKPHRPDRMPTTGRLGCPNRGLQAPKGESLLFVDSDNLPAPWCIERRPQAATARPDADL